MTDLRKAAEMALEALDLINQDIQKHRATLSIGRQPELCKASLALRQALAQPEKEFVGACVTCGAPKGEWLVDAVNMSQERVDETVKGGQEYVIDCPRCGHCCPNVDAVNISQERVDETVKREHEPVAWFVQYEYRHEFLWRKPNELEQKTALEIKPLYTAPPVSDYHEGWEEGFKAATREQEPFIYVREDNEKPFGGYEHCSESDAGAFPVYTAPQKREWVGLTDEEVIKAFDSVAFGQVEDDLIINKHVNIYRAIHSIEAKLKEKNT